MAVGQGFEPWEGLTSLVFKTSAFDHSATPPEGRNYTEVLSGDKHYSLHKMVLSHCFLDLFSLCAAGAKRAP